MKQEYIHRELEATITEAAQCQTPMRFLTQHAEGMILDEVHNAPELLSYIQDLLRSMIKISLQNKIQSPRLRAH